MTTDRFRQQRSGVIVLVATPVLIVAASAFGGWRAGRLEQGLQIGAILAGGMLALLAAIFLVIGGVVLVLVMRVQAQRPESTVFATMSTNATSEAFAAFGVTKSVPIYYVVALTPEGAEAWWGGHRRVGIRWSEVRDIATTDAASSFGGRSSWSPAMLFAVVPTPGDRVWSVSFPVIDHRFPIVWRAAYANRVLDRARELRAQAVG